MGSMRGVQSDRGYADGDRSGQKASVKKKKEEDNHHSGIGGDHRKSSKESSEGLG